MYRHHGIMLNGLSGWYKYICSCTRAPAHAYTYSHTHMHVCMYVYTCNNSKDETMVDLRAWGME